MPSTAYANHAQVCPLLLPVILFCVTWKTYRVFIPQVHEWFQGKHYRPPRCAGQAPKLRSHRGGAPTFLSVQHLASEGEIFFFTTLQ